MISITVRYHNVLRSAAGLAEEAVSAPACASLQDALVLICDRHGSVLREALLEPGGGPVSHLVVFRNRKLVSQEQYGDVLADGDELQLFPAVSGG